MAESNLEANELAALAKINKGEVKDGEIIVPELQDEENQDDAPDASDDKKGAGGEPDKGQGDDKGGDGGKSSLKADDDKGGDGKEGKGKDDEVKAPTFEESFKEKFGVDYSDELVETLKNPVQKSEGFADEQIQKINELVKSGVSLQNIIAAQSLNVEGLSDRDAVIQRLRYEDPQITDAELKLELRKYVFNTENDDPEEVEARQATLTRDGRKARKFLEEEKKKLLLPQDAPTKEDLGQLKSYKEAEATLQRQREQTKKLETLWSQRVSDNLKDYESEKVTFEAKGKEHSFEYKVSPEVAKKVKEAMATQVVFAQMFVSGENGVDMGELRRSILMAIDGKNFVKVLSEQMMSVGAKDLVDKDIKNIDMSGGRKKPSVSATDSPEKQMAAQLESQD